MVAAIKDENHRLQKEHMRQLKESFSGIVNDLVSQKANQQAEFKELFKKEKEAVASVMKDAHEKQQKLREGSEERLAKNTHYLDGKMEVCKELANDGKEEEVRSLQSEVQEFLKEDKAQMFLERKEIIEVAAEGLISVYQDGMVDCKVLLKDHKSFFNEAREILVKHAKENLLRVEKELADHTKQRVKYVVEQLDAEHSDLLRKNVGLVQGITEAVKRQESDFHKRRQQQQRQIIVNAREHLAALESEVEQYGIKIARQQQQLVQAARDELQSLDREVSSHQNYIFKEELTKVEGDDEEIELLLLAYKELKLQAETGVESNLSFEPEDAQEDEGLDKKEESTWRLFLSNARNKKRDAQKEITILSKEERLAISRNIQRTEGKIKDRRLALSERILQLSHDLDVDYKRKIKAFAAEEEAKISFLKEEYQNTVFSIESRKHEVQIEYEELKNIASITEQNDYKASAGQLSDEELFKHNELKKLLDVALKKEKHYMQKEDEKLEEAKQLLNNKLLSCQREFRTRQMELLKEHDEGLRKLSTDAEAQRQALKKHEKNMMEETGQILKSTVHSEEERHREVNSHHAKIVKQAEGKLNNE